MQDVVKELAEVQQQDIAVRAIASDMPLQMAG